MDGKNGWGGKGKRSNHLSEPDEHMVDLTVQRLGEPRFESESGVRHVLSINEGWGERERTSSVRGSLSVGRATLIGS